VQSGEHDDRRERAHRAGSRDVKILWVLFVVVAVPVAVL